MRRFAILALAAVTLVTTGCASTQSRSCSGRLTTDNGHVTRNEEDCVWGDKYANTNTKPRVVYVERAPTYRDCWSGCPRRSISFMTISVFPSMTMRRRFAIGRWLARVLAIACVFAH